jgi:hypothetical protein
VQHQADHEGVRRVRLQHLEVACKQWCHSENDVRLAQEMCVGPCILVRIHR